MWLLMKLLGRQSSRSRCYLLAGLRVDKKGKKPHYLSSCKTDAYSSESHMFFSKHMQYSSLIWK